jgi:integrase
MAHLVDVCAGLDWAGKEQSQAWRAGHVVRMLGHNMAPSEVTAAMLDGFVTARRNDGISNASINRDLSAIRVMLKRAQRLGLIHDLPLFPERRLLKESEPRSLVLPIEWRDAQIEVFYERNRPEYAQLTMFLWHIGCRVGEAFGLTWDRVDFNRNRITFVKTKGNMPRCLPIPEAVKPILNARKLEGDANVFNFLYDTYYVHYAAARDEVCLRLGLGDDVRAEWVVHTLRHTCLTMLAQRGWSAPAIAQWAGHKSLAVTQRYVHGSAINLEELMEC